MESAPLPDLSIEDLRRGDRAVWRQAYPLLGKMGWTVAKRVLMGASSSDLEEIVQQVLATEVVPKFLEGKTEAFRQVQTFRDLVGLTCLTVKNRTKDYAKSRLGRERREALDIDDMDEKQVHQAMGGETEGMDEIEHQEVKQEVMRALDELGPPENEVLILHYYHGFTTKEIAQQLNRPKNTVDSWLSRGRRKLTEHLSPEVLARD